MKVIVCFRHFKCICRKWRKGRDYSWHLHHLLREFGWGPLADLETSVPSPKSLGLRCVQNGPPARREEGASRTILRSCRSGSLPPVSKWCGT